MGFVCLKPVRLSGREYFPGDQIAEGEVLPSRVRALKASGRIAESEVPQEAVLDVQESAEAMVSVSVPSQEEDEKIGLLLSHAAIAEVFSILQMTVDDASDAIKEVQDEDILILISGTDSRSGVKKAAKAQAEKLAAERAGSQETEAE